jgi:hypothetical protein
MSTGNDRAATHAQVRLAYIDRQDFLATVTHTGSLGDTEYGAEFDRWLAQHDAEVWEEGVASIRFGGSFPKNPYKETP